jgi:hypothetical protein
MGSFRPYSYLKINYFKTTICNVLSVAFDVLITTPLINGNKLRNQ